MNLINKSLFKIVYNLDQAKIIILFALFYFKCYIIVVINKKGVKEKC